MNILDLISLIPGGAALAGRAKAALARFEAVVVKVESGVATFEADVNKLLGVDAGSQQ